jgi:RNA polymerase sigma-70 factor (ECF subfamily)
MTDGDLITQILSGDRDSYAELVRRHHQKTIGLCLSLLRNPTDAEDAAQETFIKAYNALSSFNGESQFSTWLYQIAYNNCLDFLRRKKRQKTDSWESLLEEKGEQIRVLLNSPANSEHTLEQNDLINRVLSALSDDHRNILILREMNGFSYEEIASFLRISADAVKGRLKRARLELNEKTRHFFKMHDVK